MCNNITINCHSNNCLCTNHFHVYFKILSCVQLCNLGTQCKSQILNQGPHSFSLFELKTFLKTFFTTLTTYCKKCAIFLRKLKDSLMFIMQAI